MKITHQIVEVVSLHILYKTQQIIAYRVKLLIVQDAPHLKFVRAAITNMC